ncbi:MAG: CDP-diacylglycerol--glycerol-3-phosphate 3-phosphatidyltransferase [bacterium]
MVKKHKSKKSNKINKLKKDLLTLPNLITGIRILSVPFVLILIYINTPFTRLSALVLYILAIITDYLDGYIARTYGVISVTGKLLDPLADKFIVILTFILLVSMNEVSVLPIILLLSREFYIFGIRNIAMEHGEVIPAGMSGKIKTTLQMLSVSFYIINSAVLSEYGIEFNSSLTASLMLWISLVFSYYSAFRYSDKLRRKLFGNKDDR